jgi:hypothetical protein
VRALPRLIAVASLAVALAACGGGNGTELTISVKNGMGEHRYRLTCDPPSGDVPRPAALCGAMAANDGLMLFPDVPPDTVCVGGVLTPYIEVKGQFRGEAVDGVVSSCYGNAEGEGLWLNLLPAPPGS